MAVLLASSLEGWRCWGTSSGFLGSFHVHPRTPHPSASGAEGGPGENRLHQAHRPGCDSSIPRCRVEKVIHLDPMHERVEPAIAGAIRIPEAESVAAILIEVELHGTARLV